MAQAGLTAFEKVWNSHLIADLGDGACLLQLDRLLLHDVTGSVVMRELSAAGHAPDSPGQVFTIIDHLLVTRPQAAARDGWTPVAAEMIGEARWRARDLGLTLIDVEDARQGITHVISPELGIALPGLTIACGDSHTCTLGGIGAIGWGIGTSEGAHVLATQTVVETRPKLMRVNFEGRLPPCVSAKDMVLRLIGAIGAGGGAGFAVEFAGEAARALAVEGRLTLCNMAVECSAKYGFVSADEVGLRVPQGQEFSPKGVLWDAAVAHWRGARNGRRRALRPRSDDRCLGDGAASHLGHESAARRAQSAVRFPLRPTPAMHRLRLSRASLGVPAFGTRRLAEVHPDRCGLYRHLHQCAVVGPARSRGVSARPSRRGPRHRDLRSRLAEVKRAAEAEKLDEVFRAAGFEWHEPGCGMCGSGRGRLGGRARDQHQQPQLREPPGQAHAHPPGQPADRRGLRRRGNDRRSEERALMEALREHTGIAAPLLQANIDTDQIIPTRFLRACPRTASGRACLRNGRRRPMAASIRDSCSTASMDAATILVAGPMFGCGSSREAAPRALRSAAFAR